MRDTTSCIILCFLLVFFVCWFIINDNQVETFFHTGDDESTCPQNKKKDTDTFLQKYNLLFSL